MWKNGNKEWILIDVNYNQVKISRSFLLYREKVLLGESFVR